MIVDPASVDVNTVVADQAEILKWIPQRFEMRQIDTIIAEDHERIICVGYKDVTENEFWVDTYAPGARVMPGILICEAAAQISSYCAAKFDLLGSPLVGLGGMEGVRMYGWVRPGDRLIIAVQLLKVRRKALIVCRFECFVGGRMIAEGEIRGVALPNPEPMPSTVQPPGEPA